MNCQVLYHDDTRCPHMITVKARREKIARSAAPKPVPETTAAAKPTRQAPPAFRAQAAAAAPTPPDLKGA